MGQAAVGRWRGEFKQIFLFGFLILLFVEGAADHSLALAKPLAAPLPPSSGPPVSPSNFCLSPLPLAHSCPRSPTLAHTLSFPPPLLAFLIAPPGPLSPLSPPKSAAQGKPNASITEGGYAERIAFYVYTPTLSPLSPPKSTAAAAAGAATAAAAVRAGREGDGEVAGGGGGPRLPLRRQRRAPRRPPRRPGERPRRLGGSDSDG